MAIINLKFNREMAIATVEGHKIITTRDEQKGHPGDTFSIWGAWFRLLDIQPLPLATIRDQFYLVEGFYYPELFEQYWKIVLKKDWSDSKIKYLHFFGRVE